MLKFYYIDDVTKQQCGPLGLQELLSRNIRSETLVWRSGMSDWVRADSVQELSFLFNSKVSVSQDVIEKSQKETVAEQFVQSKNSSFDHSGQSDLNALGEVLPMPKNWLIESILLSIFCCSPISVVGIYYALRVEKFYGLKEYKASVRASNLARNWTLLGMLFLPACYILFTFFVVLTGIFF